MALLETNFSVLDSCCTLLLLFIIITYCCVLLFLLPIEKGLSGNRRCMQHMFISQESSFASEKHIFIYQKTIS